MDILISGYSGFVGQNLLKYMNGRWKVHGLARQQEALPGVLHRSISWDQLSPKDLAPVDAVIHLAGKAHDVKNTSDPAAYFDINTKLTQRLFDLFLDSPARCFIYFSSVKAAADKVNGVLTEDMPSTPGTAYGQSKRRAEEYLLNKPLPEGKRLYILRPCMIHGPGNKGNLNLLYGMVNKGIPYPLAAFDNRRSFLSVDNLCYIIERLIHANYSIDSGIYNIADDGTISTNELISIIGLATGKPVRKWKIPRPFIRSLSQLGDKLKLPLNTERLEKLTENYIVSNDKIKAALEINRLPIGSAEGLEKTIRSFHQ